MQSAACDHLPSSVIRILLSTRLPRPQRDNANNDINVTEEISNNSLASNFEPAIRTMLSHLFVRGILRGIFRGRKSAIKKEERNEIEIHLQTAILNCN